MRTALGQLESGTDIQANLAVIDRCAAEAALDGARLVAFPEYATYEKKTVDATFPEVAEPLDGPVCQELANIARRHRIALVAGAVETPRPTTPWWLMGPTAAGWPSTGKPTFSTRRASGDRPSSSLGRPPPLRCFEHGGVQFGADDLLRSAASGAGQVTGRRRRPGPAGLLVMGARHA